MVSVTSWTELDEPTTAARSSSALDIREVHDAAHAIVANIATVIEGKLNVIRLGVATLLAQGHLLIEDVPGVGKTKLAKALGRSIDCEVRRIQFTPDLLPSDITGASVYNRETGEFDFKPGPVFANLVVGDEINRASPRAQAALLECMEEGQVSVDGTTYRLPPPFMVLATQNPLEMEGTYPLPEAQRDRFTARVSMGYPDAQSELIMLGEQTTADPLERLQPVSTGEQVQHLVAAIRGVHVSDEVKAYAIALADATRRSPQLRLGASPRASVQWIRVARAWAAMDGRDYVAPADVKDLAHPVLAHRLLPSRSATSGGSGRGVSGVLDDILAHTPAPESAGRIRG